MTSRKYANWKIKVLGHAKALLERGLCQEFTACLKNGTLCSFMHPKAHRFSLCGALERALRDHKIPHREYNSFMQLFCAMAGDIAKINRDAKSVDELVAICDEVIRRLPDIVALEQTQRQSIVAYG